MSVAMSRPNLPSMTLPKESPSSTRSLPPLSELLNTVPSTSTPNTLGPLLSTPSQPSQPKAAPTSPQTGATDLSQHAIPTPSNLAMKTPIRLPSFDSLNLHTRSEPSTKFPLPSTSKSFPFPSTSLPQISPVLATGSSHSQNMLSLPHQALPHLSEESPNETRSYAFISHSPSTYPSQEPSISNAQLARRKRRRTTPRELAILHEEFDLGSTPNRARRMEIARKVDMSEKAVQIWFQNRRQTLRRQSNAEREIHHFEAIYPNIPVQLIHHPHPGMLPVSNDAPIRPQPIVFTAQPPTTAPSIPYTSQFKLEDKPFPTSSSAVEGPRSPSNTDQGLLSSPNHSSEEQSKQFKTVLATPSRSPKTTQTKSPTRRSTFTFKLTKSPTASSLATSNSSQKEFKLVSTSPTKFSMTPVIPKQRQKPIMKVNPSPPRNFKGALEGNKENIPVEIKLKTGEISKVTQDGVVYVKERKPLGELRYNVKADAN